jgi:DNA primase
MIHRFTENITVLYDGDAAGIKAALRGIDLLLEDGMNVKVLLLPDGEDPDSFARKQNAESFQKYISEHETDFIRFKTQLLLQEVGDDPIKRARLISNIVQSISVIPDTIKRSVYIQECARQLEVSEKVLISTVNKIRIANYDKRKEASEKNRQPDTSEAVAPAIEENAIATSPSKNPYDRFEREIIRYIIRYATTPMFIRYKLEKHKIDREIVEEKVPIEIGPLVIDFVKYDFERDHISFTNPLYRRIFEEVCEHSADENFDSARYFSVHPDAQIGRLAADLLSDKYHLSKIHAKSIGEEIDSEDSRLAEKNDLENLVPRATTELKYAYVLEKIKDIKKTMQSANSDELVTLITQLQELQTIKKELSKLLGERIVLKY